MFLHCSYPRLKAVKKKLAKIFRARCGKSIEPPKADWKNL
jgi:hypothetical protein